MKKNITNTTNATLKSIKSTCDPRAIFELNHVICKGDNGENDIFYRKSDGHISEKPPVSAQEKQRIIAMKNLGFTDLKVALETHRSLSTIYNVKKEANMVKPRIKRNDSETLDAVIIFMHNHGIKPAKIADILGLKPFQVYYRLRKANAKPVVHF